jgi:hypothetical protein
VFIWIDRPSPPVLLAALGMPRTAEPGPAPGGPPTEEELLVCNASELRRRALLLGITQEELDRTTDAKDNQKQALVDLILGNDGLLRSTVSSANLVSVSRRQGSSRICGGAGGGVAVCAAPAPARIAVPPSPSPPLSQL